MISAKIIIEEMQRITKGGMTYAVVVHARSEHHRDVEFITSINQLSPQRVGEVTSEWSEYSALKSMLIVGLTYEDFSK